MLTQAQLEFLSKYLKYVPSKGFLSSKKHDKAVAHNEKLSSDFELYEAAKATVDELIEEIGSEVTLTRTKIKAVPLDVTHKDVKEFLDRFTRIQTGLQQIRQDVSKTHSDLVNAPKETTPEFKQGATFMDSKAVNLTAMKTRFPKMPTILEDGALPVLYGVRTKIEALKTFEGSPLLNETIVARKLTDKKAETQRAKAAKEHGVLCQKALTTVDQLIKSALGNKPPAANKLITDAEKQLSDLEIFLVPSLKDLADAINGQASGQLTKLAEFSTVAKIEETRMANVTATVDRIDKLVKIVDQNIKDLKKKFAEAQGFKEKVAIQAQLKDEKKRSEELKAQKVQLKSYEDSLALRVQRIESGELEGAKGQTLADNPAKVIARVKPDMPEKTVADKDSLLGGKDKNGQDVDGRYQNLVKMYARALKRVSVDAKLYPEEPDVTDISTEQHGILTAILEKGKALGRTGKLTEASYLFEESYKLYFTFLSANKFSLPPTVPPVPPADIKLDLAIKAAGAELDEFWGYGGDADDKLRKVLAKITSERDVKIKNAETSADELKDLQERIEAFRKLVATEYEKLGDPVLSQKGQDAKTKAVDTRNAVSKELLGMFQTKPLQLAELEGVPANKLLTVKDGNEVKYYEIQTKRGGTQDRREDKDIPLEALNMLYERSAMLDLLAEESPVDDDSAEAMDKIADETAKMLEAIKNGGPDYKHVFDQIKECKKLEAEKIFTEWVPDGFYEAKAELKNFSGDYATRFMPADARKKIDEIFQTLTTKKTEADGLKEDYKKVEALIRAVEYDLEPDKKKKGSDESPVTQFEAMMKGGTSGMFAGLISAPSETKRLNELQLEMKQHLETMKTLGTKNGLQGALKHELEVARQKLDMKSKTGITNAEADAKAIRIRVNKQVADLKAPNPPDLAYLEKAGAFLADLAKGAQKAKDDHDGAETARKETKEKLEEVLKVLDKNKATMTSYKEYKTVYDGQKKAYDAAVKDFEKAKTPAASARDQFTTQLSSAKQLAENVGKLTTIQTGSIPTVDFANWQTAVTSNLGKVCDAAKRAATTLRDKAADDDPTIIAAADEAAKVLDLAGDQKVRDIATLKGSVIKLADDAFALTGTDRKDALAVAREQVLAELRRIRVETEKHPALVVYRDNPIDKGSTWPQFASTLHAFDVEVLTKMNP